MNHIELFFANGENVCREATNDETRRQDIHRYNSIVVHKVKSCRESLFWSVFYVFGD